MLWLKKYSKSVLISILSLLVMLFIITIFSYLFFINPIITKILGYIIISISSLIGSFLLGYKTNNKGWLEGIKYGLLLNILFLIFNFLAFNNGFKLGNIIVYIFVFISSILGSIIGINIKKEKD